MNIKTKRAFTAFHRVVTSIVSTELWRDDLLRSGFAVTVGPGIHVQEKHLPDLTAFRSLMMDFRQLIANDEPSNLGRVCNLVFRHGAADEWSQAQTSAIAEARKRFNEALDRPADFYTAPEGAARPTVRQLLNGWINGEWFHGDEDTRAQRLAAELVSSDNLSLAMIVPAVREAIEAAVSIDAIIWPRVGA